MERPSGSNDLSPTVSFPRTSIGSDADYDDDLGIPTSIKVVDIGDGPVAIENSDDELEGKFAFDLSSNFSGLFLDLLQTRKI